MLTKWGALLKSELCESCSKVTSLTLVDLFKRLLVVANSYGDGNVFHRNVLSIFSNNCF
jgi:hypothetical protein